MHAIHTTPGLIIDSRPYGEAGKIISIFTRDFGLVTAGAQGIRFEKSKLRYHVRDHSFGTFSLVRGRELWRLTSASSEGTESFSARMLLIRISLILKRLLHGEESQPELFECVAQAANFLKGFGKNEGPIETMETLESLVVLRVLNHLGYIADISYLNDHIKSAEYSLEALERLKFQRREMNQHINKALKESHL